MMKSMCLSARRELLISVRQKYHKAGWQEKGKILDGFVAATDYDRKYATRLLSSDIELPVKPVKRLTSQKYDGQVLQAL